MSVPKTASLRRPGRPRAPELRAQRRQQIVDAAGRIFAQRGYAKTDLEKVAQEIGVAKGTIYLYFRSKTALFLAAVDEGMKQLQTTINVVRDSTDDPLEKIWGAVRAYLRFFDENRYVVELLVQERAQFKDRKKPTYFAYRDAGIGPWREMLEELIRAGRLRPMPVERITTVLGDLVYGTMFTNYFAGRHLTVDEQFEQIAEVIQLGILSDQERTKVRKGRR